ncbi:hypothetical protein B0H10DRAFT_2209276 [Mycena sp. CBHHK59/15]|nr:hypothetical protein B0H10DRAFT_2209276 [Mycena sp. CBHHK59/15]
MPSGERLPSGDVWLERLRSRSESEGNVHIAERPPSKDEDDSPELRPRGGRRAGRSTRAVARPCQRAPQATAQQDETYQAIKKGDLLVTGTQMPRFMYADGQVYDEDDLDAGLLQGHTLRAAVKQIFQGPGAALQAPGFNRVKAGNAALNGITSLTPRDIAYVACQVQFSLSSLQQWNNMDGTFNLAEFYWAIVDMLKGDEGAEIID